MSVMFGAYIAPSSGFSAMFMPWRLEPWQPEQSSTATSRLPCAIFAAGAAASAPSYVSCGGACRHAAASKANTTKEWRIGCVPRNCQYNELTIETIFFDSVASAMSRVRQEVSSDDLL